MKRKVIESHSMTTRKALAETHPQSPEIHRALQEPWLPPILLTKRNTLSRESYSLLSEHFKFFTASSSQSPRIHVDPNARGGLCSGISQQLQFKNGKQMNYHSHGHYDLHNCLMADERGLAARRSNPGKKISALNQVRNR